MGLGKTAYEAGKAAGRLAREEEVRKWGEERLFPKQATVRSSKGATNKIINDLLAFLDKGSSNGRLK